MSEPESTIADGGDDYWVEARQPLHCLLFLLPLLAVYEAGILHLGAGSDEVRNGADFWMRSGLAQLGLEQAWALPAIVIGLLCLWQLVGRYRWSISAVTLVGMLAESGLFGVCLIVLGQLQDLAFRTHWPQLLPATDVPGAMSSTWHEPLAQAVSFVGAGIYEEVLFRLCLLPLVYGLLRGLRIPRGGALVLSILATSALFSAAHYVGPAADAWSPYSFTFRSMAGVFFAALFVLRGFGITVGAHAAYDLLVGVMLPEFG
ncbi:MAG: CPBP family intramembrane metalloprotease [Planctomycetaceae bacterium]|nr:CPBP family intramembrane metalloprotease [Planctomycetaceae bacterium]